MPEVPTPSRPEAGVAAPPDHVGAAFKTGKIAAWLYNYVEKEYIVPVLDVKEPEHRMRWTLENMRVFSDGTLASPEEKWKPVIDSWISELKFAAPRARFDPIDPELEPEAKKAKIKEIEEKKRNLPEGVKKTELDIKAMMAVSASARAMEVSAGSAAAYVQVITGGDSNLDKQDFWGEFLLHDDKDKLIRVINNPLVKHYYQRILKSAGVKLLERGKRYWIGDWEWRKEKRRGKTNEEVMDLVLNGELVRFLEKNKGHESLNDYVSALVSRDGSDFIEECRKLLVAKKEEEKEEIDDGVRWAAARLAADAFLVHFFTKWEYELDKRRLKLQEGTDKEGKGIDLRPSPGWGGNPLRAVLEPKFLPARIKKMYRKEKEDQAILDMTDLAFRPGAIFIKAQEEFDKKPEDKKDPKDRPKLLEPSMTTHLKNYARYNDALYTFLGSSRGAAIPQWSKDMVEKDLPRIAELLDQVYGNVGEPEQNTGKHIVGAMMAKIIQCKALAVAVESARPGFRENMTVLFGTEASRPFLEIEKFIWGPNLDARSGLLASWAGGRTRLVFRGNDYGAEKTLRGAWEILATSDQDPKGRGKAKTLNTIGFILDITQAIAKSGRK